jgi:glycerol uptake facilitator protein
MDKALIGEFIGTMVLVLLGNGIVANVVLKKTKGEGGGGGGAWITIVFGWTLAVMIGVFAAIGCGSAGAHINPAVTIGLAVASGDYSKFLPYLIAQVLGGLVGGIIVYLHFLPHWKETPDQGAKLACFSTGPSIRNLGWAILCETIGSFMLVLGVACIVSTKPAAGLAPFLIGGLVGAIGTGLGGTTGFAINPARDLGPRIAHAILPIPNKGGSDWGYAPVPVVGGLVGGALAGVVISALHIL